MMRAHRSIRLTTAADKALEERDKLFANYRRLKRAQLNELYADPEYGDRLRKFAATLNHFSIDDAEELIAFIRKSARWLLEVPADIRQAAFELVSARIVRVRQNAGLAPFDDALPGEEPDVYRLCKKELMI